MRIVPWTNPFFRNKHAMEMLSFDCVHDALQAMTEQLAAAVRQKTDGPSPSRAAGRPNCYSGSGRRNTYGKSRGHGCASIGSTNDASRRTTRKAISNMPTNCCFKRSASPTTTCSGYGAKRIPNKKPGATRRPSGPNCRYKTDCRASMRSSSASATTATPLRSSRTRPDY